MRIDTHSGLRGELVEYVQTSRGDHTIYAKAIVRRDQPTYPDRPFSTHGIVEYGGKVYAENGHYDLTLEEARKDLAER